MPKKRRRSDKAEMWTAINAAVDGGWGTTLRMMSILALKALPYAAGPLLLLGTAPVSWAIKLLPQLLP